MNLLTKRAAQIEGNVEVGMKVGMNHIYIMHDMKFNCTGNISSLIMRAEIKTVTGMEQLTGNSCPTISLWNLGLSDQVGQVYTKVSGSERSIVLGPSNFSASGVIEYPLDPPIHFEDGNMLGWLQQEETVQMYLLEKAGFATTSILFQTSTVLEVYQSTIIPDRALAIYPVTGELHSCTSVNGSYKSYTC